jgi:hypothetical protein
VYSLPESKPGKRSKLTFNEIKILYYVRSVKTYWGSRNHLQELVNIDGGSFDEAMERLIGPFLMEVRGENRLGLVVTKDGENMIRFLRAPNYILPTMYIIGAGLLVLGAITLLSPLVVLRLLPFAFLAFGGLAIGGVASFYVFTRNYAREFLQIRDRPALKV